MQKAELTAHRGEYDMTYRINKKITKNILTDLCNTQYISDNLEFSFDEVDSPYSGIHYNDFAFKSAAGRLRTNETVDEILDLLKSEGIVDMNADFSRVIFRKILHKIQYNFIVPWISFTPVMERLVYMLTSLKKPENILAVGISSGYTLAFLAFACGKETKIFSVEKDAILVNVAKDNFKRVGNIQNVEIACMDGIEYIRQFKDNNFDLIYLDTRKNIDILLTCHKKLQKDGWMLQHNASDGHLSHFMKPYLDFVRDASNYKKSILFDVDTCGLELSIKH